MMSFGHDGDDIDDDLIHSCDALLVDEDPFTFSLPTHLAPSTPLNPSLHTTLPLNPSYILALYLILS